jgi:hypothetical protein
MAEVDMGERYNCNDCVDERMISMDCDGDNENPGRVPILPAVPRMFTRRCPKALIEEYPESLDLWEAFTLWKCVKVLPLAGGTDDQDAKTMEAFQFIASTINVIEFDEKYTKWKSNKNKPKEELENSPDKKEKKFNSFRDIKQNRGV